MLPCSSEKHARPPSDPSLSRPGGRGRRRAPGGPSRPGGRGRCWETRRGIGSPYQASSTAPPNFLRALIAPGILSHRAGPPRRNSGQRRRRTTPTLPSSLPRHGPSCRSSWPRPSRRPASGVLSGLDARYLLRQDKSLHHFFPFPSRLSTSVSCSLSLSALSLAPNRKRLSPVLDLRPCCADL